METQHSVHEWVSKTFPEWDGAKGRALAVVEEAVELGLAAGLSPEEIQSAVNLSVTVNQKRVDVGDTVESDVGEVGDVLLNIYAYAEERNISAQAALDAKMAFNRSRPFEYYQAKTLKKKDQGLLLQQK